MSESIEKSKPYTLRKLDATDIFPMSKILSKIGLNEFGKCFETKAVKETVTKMKSEGVNGIEEAAAIQVLLEISNVILTHLSDCEKELYILLASVSGQKVEDIKKMYLPDFAEMIIDFVKKEEFMDFFKVVSKLIK